MNEYLSLNTRLLATPARAGLQAEADGQIDVLVRLQAPEAQPGAKARPPYGIALVIDRSGSMSGRPLEQARRCATFVLDSLHGADKVSLTQFDNRVEVLSPACAAAESGALRLALSAIHSGGNTNLHGGWRAGADSLAGLPAAFGIRRVVLLSDGQANEGVVETEAIAAQCRELAAVGVTTSTYGLGSHFNEELMVAMADAGQGNHYYGDTADDLMEPFRQEFALLANLCLKKVVLTIALPEGIEAEMLNDCQRAEGGGWQLPDVAWASEAWCVLRIRVLKARLPSMGSPLVVARVRVVAEDLDGRAVQIEQHAISVPVVGTASWQALPVDELVARRVAELEAAVVLRRMREAAGVDDWAAVGELLATAEAQFAGNEWVAAILASMRGLAAAREQRRFMKESMFSSARLSKRLSAHDEVHALAEDVQPLYLRRKAAEGKSEFDES